MTNEAEALAKCFALAVRNVSIYPVAHPRARSAAEDCLALVRARGGIILTTHDRSLGCNGCRLGDDPQFEWVVERLRAAALRGVVMSPHCQHDDLLEFARALVAPRRAGKDPAFDWPVDHPRLRVLPLTFTGTFGGGGEGVSGGDTLRACPAVGGGWTLENDGVCGGVTSQSVGTNQGPGGREFYADGFATTTGPGSNHQEISVGGLAKVPGFTDVVHTVFDPNTSNGNDWRSGGLRKLSNTTGRVTGFFQLFDKCDSSGVNCPGSRTATLTFGKVNGIGDVVALCDMAPVEIGNRVWSDENGNGVQDPGEPAIAGVPVSLEIGSTTYTVVTDMNGVYRFSSDTRWSDTASAEFGVPQMSDGAAAVVTFPTAVTLSGVSRPITRRDAAGPN
ncbi:MAG: hypothetical protein KDE27_30120, partial [Planctomycetes bacterium]|nr:hypothetical protein [Planctomycetota bacterium]